MKVKNHVIVLLDVLGYKNILMKMDKEGKANAFLQQIFNLMSTLKMYIERNNKTIDEKWMKKDYSNIAIMSTFQSLLYSDNILFFAPYNDEIEKHNLYNNLAYGISAFLYQYPKEDIFFRGAITEGPLYYDEQLHFVYGTGLVRAYELESNIAIYPRIIIDRRMQVSPILFGYRKDFDEEWFIDYLHYGHSLVFDKIDDNNIAMERINRIVSNHKAAIQKAIKDNQYNERVLQKYLWLAHYHNMYCKNYKIESLSITIPE